MSDASDLAESIADRAGHRCEYCWLPQEWTSLPFQIDHIIALKHDGPTSFENLAWACAHCNMFKGPNLAGRDHSRHETVRLFDPRNDRWDDHFVWNGAVISARTSIGRVTIDILRMNLLERVAVRESLLLEGVFLTTGENAD